MKIVVRIVFVAIMGIVGATCWATEYHVKKIYADEISGDKKYSCLRKEDPYITVWIHGIGVYLWGGNHYNLGLRHVSEFTKGKSIDGIAQAILASDPQLFPAENVFVFSWSGMSGFAERDKASCELYTQLKQLVEQYRARHGIMPKVRLLAFSHGGNVALNLAAIKDENKLFIDELVLIGTPAQKRSSTLIADPMFKHVFNLYSTLDLLQCIDPQGIGRGAKCSPLFTTQRYKELDKMIQAKVKMNGHGVVHITLNSPKFLCYLPAVLDQLNVWLTSAQSQSKRDYKVRYLLSLYKHRRICGK